MKNYLAIYVGTAAAMEKWQALDEKVRKEQEAAGMKGWMKWVSDKAGSIVEMGGPLGKTKRVNAQGIGDIKNQMMAFTIVQAESHEAAAKLFTNHPHFMLFPGDSVEIMEVMPVPTM